MSDVTVDLIIRLVNIVACVVVIAGVVVTHYDTRGGAVNLRAAGVCRKAAYRIALTVFMAAVGFGEGLMAFNWALAPNRVPDVVDTATAVSWALLGGWLLIVRPFARLEVLCPFATRCPAVHAQMSGVDPEEALEAVYAPLGRARAYGSPDPVVAGHRERARGES